MGQIVHFSFGTIEYPIQEVLMRTMRARGFWALLLPAAITASFSGFFEIIEAVIAMLVNPELGAV
jgi:putative membrane protein